SACTNSNYAAQYRLPGIFAPTASYGLVNAAVLEGERRGARLKVGSVFSSDTFYDDANSLREWQKMGVLAVEMEAAALYCNAARAKKQALCLLTISDLPFKGEECTALERQETFLEMMHIALSIA
ncbi:MAG TPA: purine-nucleoside phosphorylase, partial [Clostridia bacterium]|nr:purine-nucleoside phosphorylase [Clostridia bacterium]